MKKYEPKQRHQETIHYLEDQPARDTQALILPISLIKITKNIRAHSEDVTELAGSIKLHGLLQPLIVRKISGGFELVAGHRRLKALDQLGIKEVAVRIQSFDETTTQVVRLIENLQREDLSGADEILAVFRLLPAFEGRQHVLAEAIGKSKSYVSRCVKVVETFGSEKVATSQLSKSALFELADRGASLQGSATEVQSEFTVKSIRKEAREASGPVSGGRYVDQVVHFEEVGKSGAFSLRINYCPERTPEEARKRIIIIMDRILKQLSK